MTADALPAGRFSVVTRVGNEIRRETRPTTPAVHALLLHLERVGFDGAPRVLGLDHHGRERLTYIEGEAYERSTPEVLPDRLLPAVGRLVRRFHDAVASFAPPLELTWFAKPEPDVPGDHIICHNDVAPRNMIFRAGEPVAIIDWDLAYPAPAVWDVAHMVWQFVPILDDEHCLASGWTYVPAMEERIRRLRLLVDAYGLTAAQRRVLPDVLPLRIGRTASGIRAMAEEGHPVFAGFLADGTLAQIERARAWSLTHAGELASAIG